MKDKSSVNDPTAMVFHDKDSTLSGTFLIRVINKPKSKEYQGRFPR